MTIRRSSPHAELVTVTIDGRRLEAERGAFVLQVAREAGIEIPTLCDHPDVEPIGACRVCMVEVTHPDWGGWSGLMTSCLYPISEGLQISTNSPRVIEARRGVLSLLAARCPSSSLIQDLARRHDTRLDRLLVNHAADSCILCGLCTRVCTAFATGAISTCSRGSSKRIGTFADAPPNDCVGCGACALVCPTGEIEGTREPGSYTIWQRSFETATCSVDTHRCFGCGGCEEACPFSVARIMLQADGRRVATIPAEHCRGCGACVGACPSGAIEQRAPFDWPSLAGRIVSSADHRWSDGVRRVTVFACARADLQPDQLSPEVNVVELPCTGRVSIPMLLLAMIQRADGVLVLGRHQATCRFSGAEDPARALVARVQVLLDLLGLQGSQRLRFVEPDPGRSGPSDAVGSFIADLASVGPSILEEVPPPYLAGAREGVDAAMAMVRWLATRPRLHPDSDAWLSQHALPKAKGGRHAPVTTAVVAGDLPFLQLLCGRLTRPLHLCEALSAAVNVLARLGAEAPGIELDPDERPARRDPRPPVRLDDLLRQRGLSLPRPEAGTRIAFDGDPAQRRLLVALGYEPVDVGPDPLPRSFAFSPAERLQAEQRLALAEQVGARAMLVGDPGALARWGLITRQGTWRSSRVAPMLGVQLAQLAMIRRQEVSR